MAAKLPTASPYKVVEVKNQQPAVHTVCPPYPHRDTLCVAQSATKGPGPLGASGPRR